MDWSLLGCGTRGHITYAPHEPALRDRVRIVSGNAPGWRCLRCGTFVVGEPTTVGPASAAPRVRRGKELRSAFILRIFAVERFLRAIIFGVLAYAAWRFSVSRTSVERAYDREVPAVRSLLRQLGFNVNHSKLLGLINEAFKLNSRTLTWVAIGAGAYALIEIIEAVGLWLLKRWGEYFAMVATSVGLPYEIYDLTLKVTVLRVLAFLINLALVLYLVLTKRLFGVRGGKKAYEARLRSESVLQTEINALDAERLAQDQQAEDRLATVPGAALADSTSQRQSAPGPSDPDPGPEHPRTAGTAPGSGPNPAPLAGPPTPPARPKPPT